MAGKFINTDKKVVIDSLVEGFKERLKNPYYIYQDKQPTVVTYYSRNFEKSTLDAHTKLEYAPLGDESPTLYNKINNFLIYGIEKITLSIELGEWGLESSSIEDEAIILPNTIEPVPGDYFLINYLDKDYLFRINDATPDTLENGANFFKVTYKFDQIDNRLEDSDQVAETYNMIINNIGTRFSTIIKSDDYDFINVAEDILTQLKNYYVSLFYNSRVQTFTFLYNNRRFYDPFLIEFLIRNKLMSGSENYIYISHQTSVPMTMAIDYNRTFFRNVELKSRNIGEKIVSTATLITDPLSIFNNRIEDYYEIKYTSNFNMLEYINNIDPILINAIKNNEYIQNGNLYYNIIIKYFNNKEINSSDIEILEETDYQSNIALFYCIPIIIFIIESIIKDLLK